MDFIDRLKVLSSSARARVPHTRTEEATKTALVMPFLQALGYDVFDPLEVVPEYVADVGIKRGEKVDYAVLKENRPIILVECKAFGSKLDLSSVTQLFRYFSSSSSRFGILTDGMIYRFFADLEEPNRMDEKPFFEFDLSTITKDDAQNLKRFTKESFDSEDSIRSAENLKYTAAIKWVLTDTLKRPNPDFVRFIVDQVHGGPKTKVRIEKFTNLTKHAFQEFIDDRINDRLQSALERERDESGEVAAGTVSGDSATSPRKEKPGGGDAGPLPPPPPRFWKDGDKLHVARWSEKTGRKYIRRIPQSVLWRIARTMRNLRSQENQFKWAEILERVRDGDAAPPHYQVRTCLNWLEHVGAVTGSGRGVFRVNPAKLSDEAMDAHWQSLPTSEPG